MKKRVLKKWVKNYLCGESMLIFSFIAMINDFTFNGLLIIIGLFVKLFINILILSKYTNVLDMED